MSGELAAIIKQQNNFNNNFTLSSIDFYQRVDGVDDVYMSSKSFPVTDNSLEAIPKSRYCSLPVPPKWWNTFLPVSDASLSFKDNHQLLVRPINSRHFVSTNSEPTTRFDMCDYTRLCNGSSEQGRSAPDLFESKVRS